ncbi:hypothetical protein MBRA1_000360 [Malassezia brasiliensis]|uniref:Chromatin assembly factor 1 subunit A n=1 Tax=Malassezia brasiliensis TaxID=1821822 RepID=A0AAF0IRB5_9BASI|nr:hypothetical protein MBRA1_000360 [Malassezia brasiliensis]
MAERAGDAAPSPNTPKRKTTEQQEAPKSTKKVRAPPPLVTLRNSRLNLRQKGVDWDRTMPVLRAVLGFQSYLAEHANAPLDAIPQEHIPVVASLTQESDKTAAELAKLIRATLLPEGHKALEKTSESGDAVDVLPVQLLQTTIESIAQRVNYGIDAPPDSSMLPSLQIWRWEVNDMGLLPEENLGKLLARREERGQAKVQALEQFNALPEDMRQSLLDGKKVTKGKDAPVPPTPAPKVDSAPPAPPVTPVSKEKSERSKLRESKKAERQAREQERQAKEQKNEKDKQAQVRLFNSFFQQPITRASPKKEDEEKNDFQRTFLPCEYKNMANLNPFYHEVDDTLLRKMDAREQTKDELLAQFKRKGTQCKPRPRGIHPPVSVRDIMKCVQESDVLGGNAEEQTKHELEKLNNRRLLPIKLLHFQMDRRPGWVGTWSRASTFITPRKPFGQDPVALDYSYDSDAEWEEEEGENVDAMDDRDDEESIVGSDNDDSEMDDWLEDDLEVIEEVPPEQAEYGTSDVASETKQPEKPVNVLQPKKKIKLLGRRFDSKLVPYITGPHWERTLGEPTHDSFIPYRIQFLNDAYAGLDPFTFTSTTIEMAPPSEEKTVPKEPAESAAPTSTTNPSPAPTTVRTPKFNFPDTHLPELLKLIQGSTRSKPALLEDLREHFGPIVKGVSKAAIETRLQECATRESKKPGSKWVIKPEWQGQLDSSIAPQ